MLRDTLSHVLSLRTGQGQHLQGGQEMEKLDAVCQASTWIGLGASVGTHRSRAPRQKGPEKPAEEERLALPHWKL